MRVCVKRERVSVRLECTLRGRDVSSACVRVSVGTNHWFACELEVCAPGTYLPSPRTAGTVCVACPSGKAGCGDIGDVVVLDE